MEGLLDSRASPMASFFPVPVNPHSAGTISNFSSSRMTPPSGAAADLPTGPPRQQLGFQPFRESTPCRLRQDEPHGSQTNSELPPSVCMQTVTQGERIKVMVKCVNNLRYLGVESDVPLPKICVVGDQSAGKSSLVETLSGIKVPRAEGCCTRCPLEVNLIGKGGPWRCCVFIIKEYDYVTNTLASQKVNRKHPMGPWSPRPQAQVHPFGATESMEEVRDLIHHAQLAVLNPTVDPIRYVPGAAPDDANSSECLEVKFSPNIIRLDIQGPEYCNLSFTDLPGIITMSEIKTERYLVELVANLMKEHIKRKSCIVILTLPMNTDVENSTAFAMIRDHSAEERTLGVLTKPDRVQSQAPLIRWQDMLFDKSSFRLGHGFHAVMMHPDVTLHREAVLNHEKIFFDGREWQATKLRAPEKLGIPSLTLLLERLLATKISEELPNITQKVNERFAAIQHELQKYRARPSVDRYQFELGQLLSKLGFGLADLFGGQSRGTQANPLTQKWSSLSKSFRKALIDSRPSFEISSAAEKTLMAKLRTSSKPSTPLRTIKSERMPAPMEISSDDETEIFLDFKKPIKSFTLEHVGECYERRNSTHIPGQTCPQAIDDLNRQSVSHWKKPAYEFVGRVGWLVKDEVKALTTTVFSSYQNTGMYMLILNAIETFLENALQDQKEEVVKMFRMEHEHPLTLDDERMAREKEIATKKLSETRVKYRARLAQAKQDSEATAKGKVKLIEEKDIFSEQDPFSLHIKTMAVGGLFIEQLPPSPLQHLQQLITNPLQFVVGYYQIAASRFADNICLAIQSRLFARCARELEDTVAHHLGTAEDTVDARARIIRLMSDDPQSEIERNRLLEERDRLMKAQQHLERVLGRSSVDDNDQEMNDGVRSQEAANQITTTDVTNGKRTVKKESRPAPQTPGKRKRSPEINS